MDGEFPPRALPAPSEDDFLQLLQNLLPRGRAWPRDPDANLTLFLRGIAKRQAAARARQIALSIDAFPTSANELLPEWELTLGLPDPCLGPNPLTSARQAAVKGRLTATGGQTVPYYQQLAVSLGGRITVTEYQPFRLGIDCFQSPLRCAAWAYVWTVKLTAPGLFLFHIGESHFGEPFWQASNNPIFCEIDRLKPAHTDPEFVIVPGVPGGGDWFLADLSLADSGAVVL